MNVVERRATDRKDFDMNTNKTNTETAFNRAGIACLAVSAAFTVLAVALDACGIKLGMNASFALACLGMGVPFMSGIALKGIAAVWC